MSTKRIGYCDRCGAELHGCSRFFLKRQTKCLLTQIFGHGPYDYSETLNDLCDKCGKGLDEWLKGK